jgi:alpha-beta hydrolase superfamily lysophospholipase
LKTFRQKANNPQGVVFMFHGLNSRIGHGAHIAKYLASNGYEVVGVDHRGFGHSKDTSSMANVNWSNHLKDSKTFV